MIFNVLLSDKEGKRGKTSRMKWKKRVKLSKKKKIENDYKMKKKYFKAN